MGAAYTRRSGNLGTRTHADLGVSADGGALAGDHDSRMTQRSVHARIRRPSWLAVGVVALTLGVGALVASAPLLMLETAGWPWMTTMSEQTDPPSATAKIVEEDGTVHQFTGTPSDARAWLVDTEDRLKKSHDIYTKIAVGRAMSRVGVALLATGCAILLWRMFAAGFGRTRKLARGARDHLPVADARVT